MLNFDFFHIFTIKNQQFLKKTLVTLGSNANEGYWSLMYLLPNWFPNNELKISDREFTEDRYQEAVSKVFSFYPKPVG